ncbi:MAG: polyprenyl synthetase family protein [Oceanipulchritudo sp.]
MNPSLSTHPDPFREIVEPFAPAFTSLEAFLEEQVSAFEPEVQPLVKYCFGHSGKRLRPILVFAMAGESPGASPDPSVIQAAAIVELVHLATLVHDDILDGADLRHRSQTIVARHGPQVAVLLGDTLFAHALHLAAGFPDVEVCRSVSMATRQVCSGEIAQTFARGEAPPDMAAYYRIIDLKTAELFSVSAYLGGLLSGFNPEALAAARAYARHLGIAYQIYDDAADIFGREAQAGKTLGTDLATGKFTLPVLSWIDSHEDGEREAALQVLAGNGFSKEALRERLLRDGVLERVREAFFEQIQSARGALQDIPGASRNASLERLAGFVESAWNAFSIR